MQDPIAWPKTLETAKRWSAREFAFERHLGPSECVQAQRYRSIISYISETSEKQDSNGRKTSTWDNLCFGTSLHATPRYFSGPKFHALYRSDQSLAWKPQTALWIGLMRLQTATCLQNMYRIDYRHWSGRITETETLLSQALLGSCSAGAQLFSHLANRPRSFQGWQITRYNNPICLFRSQQTVFTSDREIR